MRGDSTEAEGTAPILRLGDPVLRRVSETVTSFGEPRFAAEARRLEATLEHFRMTHGFGRAISAPQIGVSRRVIAMNLGDGPRLVVNPRVVWESPERFTMWDDCMSFPDLLVRVERASSISVELQDERGELLRWERLDTPTSELLQHEIDHLDGILAVDRATGPDALVLRDVFDANRERFLERVDYAIPVAAYRRSAPAEQ